MWQIKDVARMTGVKKEDIQSICDKGKPKSFIFCPEDSRQGRRYFTADDVTKVFLVGQYQKMGYKLPEIKKAFDSCQSSDTAFEELTARQVEELQKKRDELDKQIEFAKELHTASKGRTPEEAAEALLRKQLLESSLSSTVDVFELLDIQVSEAELDSALAEKLGLGVTELLDLSLSDAGAFNELTSAQNASFENTFVTILKPIIEEATVADLSPASPEIQTAIDVLIKQTAQCTGNVNKVTKAFACVYFMMVLHKPNSEMFVELCFGKGAFEFAEEALFIYAKANILEGESS